MNPPVLSAQSMRQCPTTKGKGKMATDGKARRVLIVEDDALLAMHLEDVLIGLGHEVVGMAARVDDALSLARDSEFDFAVLDVNIADSRSFPVADVLRQRGIPFVFASGYGTEGFPEGYGDGPILRKPYGAKELERIIAQFPPPTH
jgi:DNA-binding response OmpR family regulator